MMEHDVIVVGAGVCGTMFASRLWPSKQVYCMDQRPRPDLSHQDHRVILLTPNTLEALRRVGVAMPTRASIHNLHLAYEQHTWPMVCAHTMGRQNLAQVFDAQAWQKHQLALPIQWATSCLGVAYKNKLWHVRVQSSDGSIAEHCAPCLVAADGATSSLRQYLGLRDYPATSSWQSWVTRVHYEGDPSTAWITWQRDGCWALLPSQHGQGVMVWTGYQQATQWPSHWPVRTSDTMGTSACYPLLRVEPPRDLPSGVICLGQAYQSMAPAAAQGLNQGIVGTLHMAAQYLQGKPMVMPSSRLARLASFSPVYGLPPLCRYLPMPTLVTWLAKYL